MNKKDSLPPLGGVASNEVKGISAQQKAENAMVQNQQMNMMQA